MVGERIDISLLNNPLMIFGGVAVIIMVTSLLSGIYPAQMLARFNPADSLKGNYVSGTAQWLRKGLITFQFVVTLMLITGTIVIYKQVSFMQDQQLGFSAGNIAIKTLATAPSEMDTTFQSALQDYLAVIRGHSAVNNATVTSNIPGRENDWVGRLRDLRREAPYLLS